jgi:hypothetical protein
MSLCMVNKFFQISSCLCILKMLRNETESACIQDMTTKSLILKRTMYSMQHGAPVFSGTKQQI